jgi:SAM-dependent methyltransferase
MSAPTPMTYDSFVAEYYDFLPTVTGRADLDFYLAEAKKSCGPVLELGCGTGRVLLQIARAGFRVTGLDLSEMMLRRCREKLASEPHEVQERISLHRGDMADFDLGEKFGRIIVPFRPFQHLLEVREQLACLRCAHRHLEPGGRLILDLFQTDPRRMHDPAFLNEEIVESEATLPDGRKLRLASRLSAFHRAEQFNDCELIFYVTHPDGRTERLVFAFPLRYFFRYEVEHLLARCGFRVAELYGDFDRTPLSAESREMLFIAEKIAEGNPA